MAQQNPPTGHPDDASHGDPWHAFGYLVAGVLVYGLIGWALDRWLGTSWLVVVGILVGVTLGLYATWARFNKPWQQAGETPADRTDTSD
jgi:ATP synthase protein I